MEGDLNSLLDDALADFDKPAATSSGDKASSQETTSKNNDDEPPMLPPPVDVFKEFFDSDMSDKLQEEWNSAMKELREEDPDLANHMKFMSQCGGPSSSNANQISKDNESSSVDAKMKEALESMAKGMDDSSTDDMMQNMLNLNLQDSSGGESGLPGLEMMEDMMKMMLSKEMLYPPMKEMQNNYPAWLENNKDSLSAAEKNNYEKQLVCIKTICKEFECETVSDSEEVKKNRFTLIMNSVNEMQQYGQPPASLMGEKDTMPQENCIIS